MKKKLVHILLLGICSAACLSSCVDKFAVGDAFLEKLYPADYVQEDKSVLPFSCALGAVMQAALCARHLCGRPVEPGRLYSFDLEHMDLADLKL